MGGGIEMSEQSDPYVLGGTQTEQERLVAQAAEFEVQSRWLLDQINIEPGWRAVDIGCGPIGILNLLSERVGPSGSVVGLEREQRFVTMARSQIAQRGMNNVEIMRGDALNTGLSKAAFDFVHERLVMINVPTRPALLQEMISLLRPGGTIALEEVDDISYTSVPLHP